MRAGHVGGAQRRCRVAACRRRTWRHLKLEHQGHGSYAHFLPAPRRGTASRMRVSLSCPWAHQGRARASTRAVTAKRPRQPTRCGRNDSLRGATSILSESHFHSAPSADLAPRAARHGRPSLSLSISTRCPALRLCVQASVVWLTCLHTNLPAPSWPSPTSQEPSWSVCCCVRCRPTL